MAAIGQVIDDKYEILKLIGQGGMSKVYLAMDKRLNKQWAIKEIEKHAKDKNNEIVIQSAVAEANLIKQFDHPSIVRIVDIIDNGDVIYIIEDYIEGETLSTILENNGAQPQSLVIEWAMQLCEALEYLHSRTPPIVYRDMKPANVMLKPDGNIKVIDFGIAREYKEQSLADTVSLGTKGYAAPEQFGGKGQTDARTDIYGLGITIYHLVTGQSPCEPPYEIYPIRHWNPQLSAGLEAIVQKCTQLNPNDRYHSAAELLYALHHYEEYGAAYRAKQRKKLRTFMSVAGVMILSLIVGCVGLLMRSHTNKSDYNMRVSQAENSSAVKDQIALYSQAIDIRPLENKAYLGMITACKYDAVFTIDEETILKSNVNENLAKLRERPYYPALAFEIGKLYWYYYDYGRSNGSDNQMTRMISAIQWFNDAVKYGKKTDTFRNMSTIYRDIGKFNRDITLNIKEASDKNMYKPYWENIKKLVSIIEKSGGESEIIELEVYKLSMYTIETYAHKLKSDGISQSDILELYSTVKRLTMNVTVTSDTTADLKNDVMARFDSAEKAIENAFRKKVGV